MNLLRPITAALLLACAPLALAQAATPAESVEPAPATEPVDQQQLQEPVAPEPTLIMREMLVIQADRYDNTANNPQMQATALPHNITKQGRDKLASPSGEYVYAPMPLGIVSFEGKIDEPISLRFELTSSDSSFQAHWPKDTAGNNRVIWKSIQEAGDKQKAESFDNQGDWLAALRDSDDRLWIRTRDEIRKERFLLYDASIKFTPAIDLAFKDDQYRLKAKVPNQTAPPICLLVRKTDDGWTGDKLAAPWPKPNPSIATKTSETAAVPSLRQALAPIKDLLESRGYNEEEIKLALGMVAAAGFDKSRFSLVYVLPQGGIDEHIKLDTKPQPDQLIRTAIVVVNNIDPGLGSQVNALIDDLGADQWLKRNRAQRELIDLGEAAIKKVQQLKNHKDPEVALRARQILEAYDWKRNGGK